jgi:AraC-like DNA-binding protein
MSGAFYCRSELSAPWALALPPAQGCLSFHVVTAGHCWLAIEGERPRLLGPGDLALVPHGEGHRLLSEPGAPAAGIHELHHERVSERYAILRHGGGGPATNLVCGAVRFDHPAARHLVRLLPRTIHVEASISPDADRIQNTLRFMAAEAEELRPGGETIVTRLADILVIQAIRSWIERDPAAQSGWLGALQDEQIGRAISLIHGDPARAWTLASLAREAAMSRSTFAARFSQLVGEPAKQYLTRWRMQVAHDWLATEDVTLDALAGRLGYRSTAAFSRAFKRFAGMAPGAARRSGGAGAAAAEVRSALTGRSAAVELDVWRRRKER